MLGKHSLAKALSTLRNIGLLTSSASNFIDNTFCYPTNNQNSNSNGMILSQREMQCLYQATRGKTAKQIAKALSLSNRTVEHYLDNIKNKMGVSSKAELIAKAMECFFLNSP